MSDAIDKTIFISGASSGIGEATARELAGQGACLFIGARRTDRVKALAAELGSNFGWRALDVTDAESFVNFADAAQERFGQVDVQAAEEQGKASVDGPEGALDCGELVASIRAVRPGIGQDKRDEDALGAQMERPDVGAEAVQTVPPQGLRHLDL